MRIRIEATGKELIDVRPAELAWRQTDAVDDDEVRHGVARARIEMRRQHLSRARE